MPEFGLLGQQPWWVPVLYIVVLGHITNLCVTLYLHRSATHEGVIFHPVVTHFFRCWLWLTTGVTTKQWVAVHRKHHAFSDREGDPHSPQNEGLLEILFGGVFYYRDAAADKETLEKYGRGCPDDWVENNVYTPHTGWGIIVMLVVDLLLFGPVWGLVTWASMAIWLPIFGAVINGIGHAWGYRNFKTKDSSRNIVPFGIWIVGEELHNNHHADPRSASFRAKWYEFDIGWVYIKLLSWVKLANVVYARSLSARDFAEKYYHRAAAAAASAKAEVSAKAASAGAAAAHAANNAKAAASAAAAQASAAAEAAGEAMAKPRTARAID